MNKETVKYISYQHGKKYETKMSNEFFEWLEKCPVPFMFVRNYNYHCNYSFYFNEGNNEQNKSR